MQSIRVGRIAAVAAAAILITGAAATAASAPGLTTSLKASVSPNHLVGGPYSPSHGMPISLSYDARITHPAGSRWKLTRVQVLFPAGVGKPNGNLFPSCSEAKLKAAHNRLSACPPGSKIGSGVATGTAVDLGVTSTGRLTLFNGPHGNSVVFNVVITVPALINDTFTAPLKKIHGRYGYSLTNNIPADLQTIIGGPIVVRRIQATTNRITRVVHGVKRGYIEAYKCPKSHKAPIQSTFFFLEDGTGATADSTANANISCH
ncbi:MAG TPA: hypothetical protein VN635_06880 [Conexibacter sp.]|nr:hypothetical protein [Conexibacter sp.]